MKFLHHTCLGYACLIATSCVSFASTSTESIYTMSTKQKEGEQIFQYTFFKRKEGSTSTDDRLEKALDFKGFVALGEAYRSNESAYQVLNAFLDDIRDRLNDRSHSFIVKALTDQNPFIFTLEKQSWTQNWFQGVTTGHFDTYFEDKKNQQVTMLIVTSPNKNILLVPRNKYPTLYVFAAKAPQEDRNDFWVLFFAFLKEYKNEMSKIGVNIKNAQEDTVPHLHIRFTPKKVIAKYEREMGNIPLMYTKKIRRILR